MLRNNDNSFKRFKERCVLSKLDTLSSQTANKSGLCFDTLLNLHLSHAHSFFFFFERKKIIRIFLTRRNKFMSC